MKSYDIQTQARDAMIADKTLGDAKRSTGIVHRKINNITFWGLDKDQIDTKKKQIEKVVQEAITTNYATDANENDGIDSKVKFVQGELK
jgi:16S rRNA C1402 N4-methylase RsmH